MPTEVKLKDIVEAVEAVSDSMTFYLDKRTGQVEMISEDLTAGMDLEDEDEVDDKSEWLREAQSIARDIQNDEGENFVELPSKFDINDYEIMERFSRKYPDNRVSLMLLNAIKGTGAFRRFNALVFELSLRDEWYSFQQQAYEEIAIDWLEANEISYTRGD